MPSVLIAHVWWPPAVIWVTVPVPAGTLVCPSLLSPQQVGVPSVLIAHVWAPPAVIWVTVPVPDGMLACA